MRIQLGVALALALMGAPALRQTYHDRPRLIPGVVPMVGCPAGGGPCTGPAGPRATLYANQQTVTLSAAPLPSQALVNGVVIPALITNAGIVCIGPAGVTLETGYCLQPGEPISSAVLNLDSLYVIGSVAGDAVKMLGN